MLKKEIRGILFSDVRKDIQMTSEKVTEYLRNTDTSSGGGIYFTEVEINALAGLSLSENAESALLTQYHC